MAQPSTRRQAREAAVQFLFSHELNAIEESASAEAFWKLRPTKDKVRAFADELLRGVVAEQTAIDEAIASASVNYRLERITVVDRNILRLATYEILFRDDIPTAVSINEAVEIARRFGTQESPAFVNGILDRVGQTPHPANPPASGEVTDADGS